MIEIMVNFSNMINDNYVISCIIAFVGGILSSFSPCMISTLPLIIAYISFDNNEKKSRFHNIIVSSYFSLGIIITFILFGVLSVILGNKLRLFGNWYYLILAVILLISALNLFGIFSNKNNVCKRPKLKKNLLGAFLLGIIGGIFDSPCSTPILVSILTIVATKSNIIYGIILMMLYSIGHCIIIIMAGMSADFIQKITYNQKYIKISGMIKIIIGVILLIISLYLFYLGF